MRLLRVGILAIIAFAVLSHGAVEPWAQGLLEASAGLLLVLWAVLFLLSKKEQEIVLPPLLFPLAAFALLVLVQLALHLTASPFTTRIELQLLLSMLILFFLAAQSFRTVTDWRSYAWFIMIFAFLVAGLGLLQHLTFNGKLYWFREMHYGGIPFGPYVNRNHFAGFVELVLPMAFVPLLLGRVRRERLLLVGMLAIIPMSALFLSASRGGIISLGAELAFLALVLALRRTGRRNILVGGTVLLLAFLTVSWLGVNEILSRFSSLQSLEVHADKRASMRYGAWHIFLDHPVLGTGLGTLQQVYPPYETVYDGKIVNHAHNDYLEALAETGVLGGICCGWFVLTLFMDGLRFLRSSDNSFAATLRLCGWTGCWGLLIHSLVDFNLHIPSNLLLFLLMALLATAQIANNIPLKSRVRTRRSNEKP
ncbi:MAG TPA: O-antigen ligase family protein [Candidatus Acidoferrum sp.]